MGGQNSDTISKLGLDQALCPQTGETQRRATRAESWVVGLEPSWPGTILSIDLASPVWEAWALAARCQAVCCSGRPKELWPFLPQARPSLLGTDPGSPAGEPLCDVS